MTDINPFYNALVVGELLCALDKMGLSPMLIARQAARKLSPIVSTLAKAVDSESAKNLENIIDNLKKGFDTSIMAEKGEVFLTTFSA